MIRLMLLLMSFTCFSQVSIYIPVTTHHYNRDMLWQYADNQGGDKGLVISYEYKSIVASVGSIRNSYGGSSNLFTVGLRKYYSGIDLSLSVGVADGYKRFYYYYPDNKFPRIFKSNNSVPILLLTSRIKVYNNVGLQINISPSYINYGFYIKL